MKLTFEFYNDENGRLRCLCRELAIRKPVETRDKRKRYKFLKVMGLYRFQFAMSDILELQTAKAGDVIEVEVNV